ncbi:hypothetical protein [Sandaracinus amylolyticus]|uniref:hypothetical protein n=1 Tax=Sandaracinus amylolyticus TaxID=927083 RepID=UPI001F2F47FB|nr:hypothetical protein [Sandaracinus amylolyticus]UJR84812.1 Hypothetical protein I5071_68910 [Sandaracinus amylolyticus]
MAFPFDFAAQNELGRIALAVEAKALTGTSDRWARELRDMIATRSSVLESSAFLLVTPDRLYVWPAGASNDTAPTTVDAGAVLGSYLSRAGVRGDRRIDPRVFEDIVGWWLQDLATGVAEPSHGAEIEPIAKAVRGTRVIAERAA